eukprot:TRINITY_DN21740_c0_g1_i1.p1 TRINITY_DN21740_c0_g1~~TRINITY_DN21740_c0_g1_i1.p1  ORF type:complete len:530 (-),score=115.54 TRINITY_DN21740_c0_g1_i1:23-1612(-)
MTEIIDRLHDLAAQEDRNEVAQVLQQAAAAIVTAHTELTKREADIFQAVEFGQHLLHEVQRLEEELQQSKYDPETWAQEKRQMENELASVRLNLRTQQRAATEMLASYELLQSQIATKDEALSQATFNCEKVLKQLHQAADERAATEATNNELRQDICDLSSKLDRARIEIRGLREELTKQAEPEPDFEGEHEQKLSGVRPTPEVSPQPNDELLTRLPSLGLRRLRSVRSQLGSARELCKESQNFIQLHFAQLQNALSHQLRQLNHDRECFQARDAECDTLRQALNKLYHDLANVKVEHASAKFEAATASLELENFERKAFSRFGTPPPGPATAHEDLPPQTTRKPKYSAAAEWFTKLRSRYTRKPSNHAVSPLKPPLPHPVDAPQDSKALLEQLQSEQKHLLDRLTDTQQQKWAADERIAELQAKVSSLEAAKATVPKPPVQTHDPSGPLHRTAPVQTPSPAKAVPTSIFGMGVWHGASSARRSVSARPLPAETIKEMEHLFEAATLENLNLRQEIDRLNEKLRVLHS